MTGSVEIRGRLLARNTILNLGGTFVPLVVGVIAVPFLIRGLGISRFGVLTLIWMVAGYMSLFDLGLGRALTQLIAERLGKGQVETIPSLVWTSISLICALGIVAGIILAGISHVLIYRVLRVPGGLRAETLTASYILAFCVPFVLAITGFRGVLEAFQRFDLSNAIRIPSGVFSYLGPLLVLVFSHNLVAIVTILVTGRLASWLAHLIVCLRIVPELRCQLRFNPTELRGLVRFGSWVTVSNVVGPVMIYFDRFFVGAILSVAAVAYYATPFDFVTKINVLPVAIAAVLYPAFAMSYHSDSLRTVALLKRGSKYVFILLFPISVIIVAFAHNALALWLGEGFASHSTMVLQWLAVGIFINGLALIPFGLIQGAGRPDLTGKAHLVELVPYVVLVWWLIRVRGIEGAAIAWVIRVAVDALVLFWLAKRLLPRHSVLLWREAAIIAPWLSVFVLALPLHGPILRGVFAVLVLLAFAFFAWFVLLSGHEHKVLREHLRHICTLGQLSGDRV